MKDQLSALIDGEIAPEDASHVISGIKADGEIKAAWQHYHLIGDAMRGDAYTHHTLTSKVMLALQDEPTVLSPNAQTQPEVVITNRGASTWAVPRTWSIAASVAAVMFVGLMLWQNKAAVVEDTTPVQIAQEVPMEYLVAHQAAAPTSAAYYIQPATYSLPAAREAKR